MKYSFLGAGNLPEAIIFAMVKKLGIEDKSICVFDIMKSQYERYSSLDLLKAEELVDAVLFGDVVFLTVKPQNFSQLTTWLRELETDLTQKIFITTAAGIELSYIEKNIGQKIKAIRTMPNTPIMNKEGMTALCKNANVSDEEFASVINIFGNLGETIVIGEEKMNDIISINGSSPAYIYLFIEAMLQSGEDQGFDRAYIYKAVLKSISGALSMLEKSGKTPSELIAAVASKGGTTEAALNSFNNDNFTEIIKKAMLECTKRANELTSQYCKD